MKIKSLWMLLPLSISILTVASCKKDDVEPGVPTTTPTTVNTPEQNKSNLQNTGLSVLQDLNGMKDMAAMYSIVSFNHFINEDSPFEIGSSFLPIIVLNSVELSANDNTIKPIKQVLKSDGDETFFSSYEDSKGLYTWTNDAWVKTSANNIVFKFPSTTTGLSNDATFTISASEYTGTQMDPELSGNTPNSISAVLDVIGVGTLVDYNFSVNYLSNGEPSKILSTLTMEPYLFSFEFKNSGSTMSKSFTFDKSSSNIATLFLEAEGNFNENSVESFINSDAIEDISDVMTSANGYLNIKDIKLSLNANISDGVTYYEGIGEDDFESDNIVSLLNSHSIISLNYISSSSLIANTEWYLETVTNTNYVWDDSLFEYVEEEETSEEPNIRLVFSDGSKSDLETYFGNGFDDLINDVESFITDLETNYEL